MQRLKGLLFFWKGSGGVLLRFICPLCLNSKLRNVGGDFFFFSARLLIGGFFSLVHPYFTHLMKRALIFPFTCIDLPRCPSYRLTTGALEGAPGSPSHVQALSVVQLEVCVSFFFGEEEKGNRNIIIYCKKYIN